MNEISKYPIDISRVQKGVVFSQEELEIVLGEKSDTVRYRLGLLGLKEWIVKTKAGYGEPVRLKIEGASLRVLRDNECSEYSHRRFELSMAAAFKNHIYLSLVDGRNLNDIEQIEHQKRIFMQSKQLQGLLRIRESLQLCTYQNKLPEFFLIPIEEKVMIGNKLFTIVITKGKEGGYVAKCKEIPEIGVLARSEEEGLILIKENIKFHLQKD